MLPASSAVRFVLTRYLVASWMAKRTRSRAAIAVLLPMTGVGVGVAAFVVVLSVMGGFVGNMKSRLLAINSHIEVVVADAFGTIDADPALLGEIREKFPEVLAASPFQRADAILQSSARPATVLLVGVDPVSGRESSDIELYLDNKNLGVVGTEIVPANVEPSAAFPAVLVGSQLLSHLGAEVGDRLTLVSVLREEGPMGLAPQQFPVVVGGVMRSGNPAFDGKWAIANLDLVNRFLGTEGTWAGIQLKVEDPIDADELAHRLDQFLKPRQLRAKPWTEANKALVKALKLERWGMSFVMFMVILVACFSITISLILAVRRKSREMAILRALGMRKIDLGRIFLFHGLAVGGIGVALGLSAGLGILWLLRNGAFGFVTAAYSQKALPVLIDWGDVALVSGGSLLLAGLAALWPAIEVMRIDVIETIADRG
jgi:lipoprotein-releasing system permease protein